MVKVLMVDDNPLQRTLYEHLIAQLGIDACITDSAERALELIQEQQFNVILMDWQMPGMDGFECTRRIRQLNVLASHKPIPIIAITAHALYGDKEKCLNAGMDDYLSKPFLMQELKQVIDKWTT